MLPATFLNRELGVPVVTGIDTRALVRHLRSRGVMRGVLSASSSNHAELVDRARRSPSMAGLDLATRVSAARPLPNGPRGRTQFSALPYRRRCRKPSYHAGSPTILEIEVRHHRAGRAIRLPPHPVRLETSARG